MGRLALHQAINQSISRLIGGIANTLSANSKLGVRLGQGGTVKDSTDTVLTATLAETQTRSRRMSDNVPANGFGRILGKAHSAGVCSDLIGDKDSDTKLFRQTSQLAKELGHLHLALAQFSTAGVVRTEKGSGTVDHEESVAVLRHDCGRQLEEFHLVFRVVGASVGHVLESHVRIQAKALGNRLEAVGTKGTFSVNVDGLALGTAFGDGHLAGDTERVGQLSLSGTELAKDFGDGSSLDSTFEELVEFDGSRGERDECPVE